jgi:hypothetical protein
MKPYSKLDVTLGYQSNGSNCLIILSGPQEQIELAFNGFFNFGATNGLLSYQNERKDIATFWSSEKLMNRYWFNRGLNLFKDNEARAKLYASRKMWETLSANTMFADVHVRVSLNEFTLGTLGRAEEAA